MKRNILFIIIALAALTPLLYTLTALRSTPANTESLISPTTPISLRVAYWKLPGFYIVNLADKLGYFKEEGLTITSYDLLPGTLPFQQKFAVGEMDIIAVSNSMFYSLDLVRHGKFALVTYDPTEASVVMATGSIESPKDLKGKHLGVNSGNEFFLYWMLNKSGLKKTDVSIDVQDFTTLASRFKSGELDAVFMVAPISTKLLREGVGHVIYRAGDDLGLITAGMIFHDNLIKSNPDAVKRFNRAYFRAYRYAEEHHAEAVRITAAWLNLSELDTASTIDTQYYFPNLSDNHAILRPGIGIKNLHANINYMRLFLGGSTTTEEITNRITNEYLP